MKLHLGLFAIIFLVLTIPLHAQQKIEWQKTLGGDSVDQIISIIPTSDSGYAAIGFSMSTGGDVLNNHGGNDVLVVKLSRSGIPEWQHLYGGSGDDEAGFIIQTSDGGYAFAGFTNSNDGDVHGLHDTSGTQDAWFVKLSASGAIEWQKCVGGTGQDIGYGLVQTTDGGYCFTGATASHDGDVVRSDTTDQLDEWVVRLDPVGTINWIKRYGGSHDEFGYGIIKTSDGGFASCGFSSSNDGDVKGAHGGDDAWVLKLSETGDLQWQGSYGGSAHEAAYSLLEDTDRGYTMAGWSNSGNGDLIPGFGQEDVWLFHIDSAGSFRWGNLFGGTENDEAYSVIRSASGSYIVAGQTNSTDGQITDPHGQLDAWLIEVSNIGGLVRQKTFGGSGNEFASSVIRSIGEDLVFASTTNSSDGDVVGLHGEDDGWIVKLSPSSFVRSETGAGEASLYPNPSVGRIMMNYELKKQEHVSVEVYNLLGERIALLADEDAEQGANTFTADLSYLASGQYILSVRGDGISLTKPFVIAK
jgi:hypothetical protein